MSFQDKLNKFRLQLTEELTYHPLARLTDIFKLFTQSAFGPGHLIHDIDSAYRYFNDEVHNHELFDTVLIQPCTLYHDFYRINLSLVKRGMINGEELFSAFIESSRISLTLTESEFRDDWQIITEMMIQEKIQPDLFYDDLEYLHSLTEKNRFICHHSETFRNEYHPHYRIVHECVFPPSLKQLKINDK